MMEFVEFLNLLRSCVRMEYLDEVDLLNLYLPKWKVRSMFSGHFVDLRDSVTSCAMHYVFACCGHRVERDILKHSRLCALWACVGRGGRWIRAEGVISSDHYAMWMYARGLGGRLPSGLHNRIVLESGPVASLYLDWLAQKK